MSTRTLLFLLVGLSIGWSASAQAPAPKPKPVRKPPVATKPVDKAAAVAPPAPAPPPTDVKVRTRYVSGAQASENTTYFKGVRQRFEFPGITMITQCDLKRSLQLQDATKHFMVVPTDSPAAAALPPGNPAAGAAASGAAPKPGVVSEAITLTDTGERKQLFGLEARHIKTSIVRQPGENACDSKTIRIETDGWYADLPEHQTCAAAPVPSPAARPAPQTCSDRVETTRTGEAQLGFALSTAMTTTVETGKDGKDKDVTTMAVEVTDLKVTSLDAALFEAPADYTEVQSYQQLLPSLAAGGTLADAIFGSLADGTSTVAPKKPGVIRIGIVEPANSSGRPIATPVLRSGLMAGLSKAPFEALPIAGTTAAALNHDAAEKACDFVLVSDIAEFKTSKPNKVGGMLRKASGDGNASADVHDARVDYRLYAVGDDSKPKLTSSAKSSSGGFGVASALRVAAFAGSMYMTMGMGNGMMTNMMGPASALGGASPLGGGLMSPGMGAAMSMMSGAQAMGGMAMPGGAPDGGDASTQKATQTVQDAFAKAARQVADELKTGRLRAAGSGAGVKQ